MAWTRKSRKQYDSARRNSVKGRAYTIWNSARGRAKRAGMKFEITLEWVEEKVLEGKCDLTGVRFRFNKRESEGKVRCPYLPSIDRANSSKGYTFKNCSVVLWGLNNAKAEMNMREFKKLIKLIWEGLN